MDRNRAYGLIAAVALGVAVGVAVAPRPSRRQLARRLEVGIPRLARITGEFTKEARTAVEEITAALSEMISNSIETIRKRAIILRAPIGQLKKAIAADPVLSRRSIWVDALGDTILLHGVVEDDDEWRSVDTLARMVSPDGSVRNLLQVRRSADI